MTDFLAEGQIVYSAAAGAVTTRIGQFVLRTVTSPSGQQWFVDGRSTIWGLPEAAAVTATPVLAPRRRNELAARGFRVDGYGLPPVEDELSPPTTKLLRELVERKIVTRGQFRGTWAEDRTVPVDVPLLPSIGTGMREEWAFWFMRDPTEWVAMTITGEDSTHRIAVSHVFATVLGPHGEELDQRWLDLGGAAGDSALTDIGQLAEILVTAPSVGQRWSDEPEPAPLTIADQSLPPATDGVLAAGLITAAGSGERAAAQPDGQPPPHFSTDQAVEADTGL